MLLAARDSLGGDIVVNERLIENGNEEDKNKTITALYGESVFQQGGQIEEDGLNKEHVYVDLVDDPPEMVEKELQDCIKEANENGLPGEGTKKLTTTIEEHKSIFRIRLGSIDPAKIKPMKMNLNDSKNL